MSLERARELRQKRARIWEEAKEIHASGPEPGSEERQKFDRMMTEVDNLKTEIDTIEDDEARLKAHEEDITQTQEALTARKEFGEKTPDAEELTEKHNRAFEGWLRSLGSDDQMEYREAMRELRATGDQLVGTAGKGGNWVPTEFQRSVIEQMKAFGGMRRARVSVVNTDHGRNLDMPTYDDTGNVAQIVGEGSTFKSTHVPVTKFTLEATKYGTGPIKLSREILQDSAVDIMGVVRSALAIRMGRGTERDYAVRSSTESVGPHGLVNASTGNISLNINSLDSTTVYPALVDLIHAVDPAYRGQSEFMFPDAALQTLRKIVDGDGRPIWQPGLVAGAPDRLLGYGYIINQSLNDGSGSTDYVDQNLSAKDLKPIWFGDFASFFIRDVQGLEMRQLNERYAPEDMVALLGFLRTDGRPGFATTSASLKPLKSIITSTA